MPRVTAGRVKKKTRGPGKLGLFLFRASIRAGAGKAVKGCGRPGEVFKIMLNTWKVIQER